MLKEEDPLPLMIINTMKVMVSLFISLLGFSVLDY